MPEVSRTPSFGRRMDGRAYSSAECVRGGGQVGALITGRLVGRDVYLRSCWISVLYVFDVEICTQGAASADRHA